MGSLDDNGNSVGATLLTVGPIAIVLGTILMGFEATQPFSGCVVVAGGLLGAIGALTQVGSSKQSGSTRERRLGHLQLLGFLMYLVSGGFMIEGSISWLALFTVATLFYIYGSLVKDHLHRKNIKKHHGQ